jgi:hypothetical protein
MAIHGRSDCVQDGRPVNLGDVKNKLSNLVGTARNERAAREDKAESDIDADPNVAGTRASSDEDGDYVGRTNPQFDAEDQPSGAEVRAEAHRESNDS